MLFIGENQNTAKIPSVMTDEYWQLSALVIQNNSDYLQRGELLENTLLKSMVWAMADRIFTAISCSPS